MSKCRLTGSERAPLQGLDQSEAAHPDERLQVTVVVRRKNLAAFRQQLTRAVAGRGHLSREELASHYGASSKDLRAVAAFARQSGLTVLESDAGRRVVTLSGTVSQFSDAFDVELRDFHHADGSFRARSGPIYIPEALSGVIESVLGLDNRAQGRAHFRVMSSLGLATPRTGSMGYTPLQLASLYQFPEGTGQDECIAIIELGGGYKPADLKTYFAGLQLTPPQVASVSVDGAKNQPTGSASGPDGEVMLDIEVAGAIAPQSRIVVYFAPNTDAGFLNAITSAIHDTRNKPSIISISWGGPESTWTKQAMTSFDEAFQSAAVLGITVCVASGDGGSSDGAADDAVLVDFPASSPHVLACGGTSLSVSGDAIASETVWNDGQQGGSTGGGVSTFFGRPTWQTALKLTAASGATTPLAKRGVPDVSGDADPQSGYIVRVDGSDTVIGGTSAVAPLWAGLLARLNAAKGSPVGFINATLYGSPSSLNDIQSGDNGAYRASPGWDACTGIGSPNGQALAKLL